MEAGSMTNGTKTLRTGTDYPHVWWYGFVMNCTDNGRAFRMLMVITSTAGNVQPSASSEIRTRRWYLKPYLTCSCYTDLRITYARKIVRISLQTRCVNDLRAMRHKRTSSSRAAPGRTVMSRASTKNYEMTY